jgi:hypothetical protein
VIKTSRKSVSLKILLRALINAWAMARIDKKRPYF